MRVYFLRSIGFLYSKIVKRIFFLFRPEFVHERTVSLGELLGTSALMRKVIAVFFHVKRPSLKQSLFGIDFHAPIGLSAGFDYEARLTRILPSLDFGYGTVGTLTHRPYEGNPLPMLGRLPQSRSLMVNKGFKNLGVKKTLENLIGISFSYPVGVSIGKTNDATIKTQKEAVTDVIQGFKEAEESAVPFSYYELNISCPNLSGNIEFYEPFHLKELLSEIGKLDISRPVFIKMPISKTDQEILGMMEVIVKHAFVKAVILGNLQRDRNHPTLQKEEVARFTVGNFSGAPCRDRSDELIRLVYKTYGNHIKIIGCGGVFCAEDAYRKIVLGASLVQLITGLVFQGPQLIAEIHEELARRIVREGYSSVGEAVGSQA